MADTAADETKRRRVAVAACFRAEASRHDSSEDSGNEKQSDADEELEELVERFEMRRKRAVAATTPEPQSPRDQTSSEKHIAKCQPFAVATMRHSDAINAEQTLRRLAGAAVELIAFESEDMTGHVENLDPNSTVQIHYADLMKNFRDTIDPTMAYLQKLPAYAAIPAADRGLLFSRSFLPFVVTQLCLPPNDKFSFFGFNEHNRAISFRLFPEYRLFNEVVEEICEVLRAWKPTKTEVSLLLSLIFFQAELIGEINHKQLLNNVIQRLKLVLHGVMKSQGEIAGENRLQFFCRAYDLIRMTPLVYSEVASAIFNRLNTQTDLPTDPLYMELYVKQTVGRQNLMSLVAAEAPGLSSRRFD